MSKAKIHQNPSAGLNLMGEEEEGRASALGQVGVQQL